MALVWQYSTEWLIGSGRLRLNRIANKGICLASPGVVAIVLLVVLYYALDAYLYSLPSIYTKKQKLGFADNQQILILGSSHTLFAISPSQLTERALNLANFSQSLDLDEKLLQKNLKHSRTLQLVIIPISYFSLEERLTDTMEEWRDCLYFKYFGVSERNAIQICLDPRYFSLPFLYGSRLASILFRQIPPLTPCQIDDFGWVKNTELLTAAQAEKVSQKRVELLQSFMKPRSFELHQKIVKHIIEACTQRHIKVLIVTTPVWTTFRKYADKNRVNRIQRFVSSLVAPGQVAYGDYWSDARFVISDFGDTDHLNSIGAIKFSHILDHEFIQPMLSNH